ncbi:MAG: hypothetical protein PHC43_02685 [Candidatus Marinimicrobia bacterium]|nr:hypothetical protein [Candidatus Neomarinimicrobiota bacterium]MDD5230209.1 hypothetical protein [Candidatus Neomarinimicrobiota bacterium]
MKTSGALKNPEAAAEVAGSAHREHSGDDGDARSTSANHLEIEFAEVKRFVWLEP